MPLETTMTIGLALFVGRDAFGFLPIPGTTINILWSVFHAMIDTCFFATATIVTATFTAEVTNRSGAILSHKNSPTPEIESRGFPIQTSALDWHYLTFC